MGKIIIIVIIVFAITFIAAKLFGENNEDALSHGCLTSLGCGYYIFQILILFLILVGIIAFGFWLFS